jgi:quinol monooxygenase YgiN
MPLHIFIRFELRPGKNQRLLEELTRVIPPSRAEPGCVRIHLCQSTREPLDYYIHSEWADEKAFEIHAELPHTKHFLSQLPPHGQPLPGHSHNRNRLTSAEAGEFNVLKLTVAKVDLWN